MARFCLFLTAYLFVCTSPVANAQNGSITHPKNVKHFSGQSNTKKKNPATNLLGSGERAVKINVSSALRADYCISYEKKITKFLSSEITAGITHYSAFQETMDFFNYHPVNMVASKRYYRTGPSLKLGTRYYFDSKKEEISGSYISMEGMFRRYGYNIKNNYTSPSIAKEYSDQKEIRILYGCQENELNDVAFYDCSIGLGYRFHERKYLGYTEASNFSVQNMFSNRKNYLVFVINIKVGFILH